VRCLEDKDIPASTVLNTQVFSSLSLAQEQTTGETTPGLIIIGQLVILTSRDTARERINSHQTVTHLIREIELLDK
jgi:hypothetical protein